MMHTDLNSRTFSSIYAQGFARVGVATPSVFLTDPKTNAECHIELAKTASEKGVTLLLFTEMGLTGYSIDDLFHQGALLDATETALAVILESSKSLLPLMFIGAPLRVGTGLYNCAVAIHRGKILGVVPKSYLPNYREFYDPRYFTPAGSASCNRVTLCAQDVPFGTDIIFEAEDCSNFRIAAEICEDAWTPIPPSSKAALAGASVIVNLSASNATVGKAQYRHSLCQVQSSQCIAAYLYSAAGEGESTTDLAWDGHAMIYENGVLLAESDRFIGKPSLVVADIDLERLNNERIRVGSFQECARANATEKNYRNVTFRLEAPLTDLGLVRPLNRFPYVPAELERLDELCYEAYNIQVQGLTQRLRSSGIGKIVIGVSGGLDSSHALLVAVRAFDKLNLARSNILAYTLPGFATSDHTKTNALKLMDSLGVSAQEISVNASALQMLRDIDHTAAFGASNFDTTFENVQAGARTSLLFRLANKNNALVLGTGDLSELALGWCTYGVGDHMSHYNVNASVPKTLIQHLIRWVAAKNIFGSNASIALESIVNTEISPELIPSNAESPVQKTEDFVGPYALQDFYLFHTIRYGLRPSKIAFLAWQTWRGDSCAPWPPHIEENRKTEYDLETIRFWLRSFLIRFFSTSQFKRSAVPNGPKISSGGSLSPRGDWRAPSDSTATVWLAELDRILPPTVN